MSNYKLRFKIPSRTLTMQSLEKGGLLYDDTDN